MGYAEGGDTLEYVLDYARKLHGLPGGITPAMIWKSYTQQVLQGEPIEQFEGVTLPESKKKTAPAVPGAEPGVTKTVSGVRDRAPADRRAHGAARRADRGAGGAPASAASASASASSVSRARKERSRAARRKAVRARNAPSSVAPSSASPSSVAPQ
jgi:membrane peptidoglycan carboxypeptidase